jgi:type III secretory pathway component EscR
VVLPKVLSTSCGHSLVNAVKVAPAHPKIAWKAMPATRILLTIVALMTSGHAMAQNPSWEDVKAQAKSWKPKATTMQLRRAAPAVPKATEDAEKAFFRDSKEAKQEEEKNQARERDINKLVKFGICRGC